MHFLVAHRASWYEHCVCSNLPCKGALCYAMLCYAMLCYAATDSAAKQNHHIMFRRLKLLIEPRSVNFAMLFTQKWADTCQVLVPAAAASQPPTLVWQAHDSAEQLAAE